MGRLDLFSRKYEFEDGELDEVIEQRIKIINQLNDTLLKLKDEEIPEILLYALRHHNEFLFYLVSVDYHQECIIYFFKDIDSKILEEMERALLELRQKKYN